MKCVKDCYFKVYVRRENQAGDILDKGFYCDLYNRKLERRQIDDRGNTQLFEIVRCKECENGETLYYNKKMNVYKREVLRNAEERMGAAKTS